MRPELPLPSGPSRPWPLKSRRPLRPLQVRSPECVFYHRFAGFRRAGGFNLYLLWLFTHFLGSPWFLLCFQLPLMRSFAHFAVLAYLPMCYSRPQQQRRLRPLLIPCISQERLLHPPPPVRPLEPPTPQLVSVCPPHNSAIRTARQSMYVQCTSYIVVTNSQALSPVCSSAEWTMFPVLVKLENHSFFRPPRMRFCSLIVFFFPRIRACCCVAYGSHFPTLSLTQQSLARLPPRTDHLTSILSTHAHFTS